MLSDEQMIRRAQRGSREAFEELMRRYQQRVCHLAYRVMGRREEAEDAAQETFLLVYGSIGGYTEQGRFWPWLRQITVNCCLRRFPRELPSDEVEGMLDQAVIPGDPVEEAVLARIALEDVREAVSTLPHSYRTVIVLRYQEDLSYREIAEALGESVAVVQVRLHRARKMLTERLAVSVYDEV